MVNGANRPGVKEMQISDLVPTLSNHRPISELAQAGLRELHHPSDPSATPD